MEIGRNTPTYIAYYIFLLSFGGGWWLAKRRWQDDDDDDDSRGREPTLGSGALSFFPAPSLPATPGVSVCRCAFLRAARTVFALKFCVVANKILVSHLPSSRIRRSVICCATLFLATKSPRAARTCAASERKAFSARLESSASDRDSNISTCLDLETFLYTRLLSGR